jgi:hypothetical protein
MNDTLPPMDQVEPTDETPALDTDVMTLADLGMSNIDKDDRDCQDCD